jgi:hypothetical protein
MHSSLRPYRVIVIALVALCASLGSLGGSAFAAVAGHEIVGKSSAIDSTSNRSVTVPCPAGKQVVGAAGHKSFAAGGQALVSRIRPNPGLTSVTVSGVEDETGYTGDWGVSAWAFCATPLPGLARVAATSATNSTNKSFPVSCPAGKKLLGAGGEITGGAGQVVLNTVRPNSGLSSANAAGLEDGDGFAGNWSVTAYAVCANPPSGLQRVTDTSASDSTDKTVPANCPLGTRPLGIGGEVTNGAGQVSMDLLPGTVGDDLVGANARAFEDESGYAGNWSVTAYAICGAVSRRVVGTSLTNSTNPKTARVGCPDGLRTTGVGGDINGGAGQVALDKVAPNDLFNPPMGAIARGSEDETLFGGNWFVRSHAICATPLAGLELVSSDSATDSGDGKFAVASCPSGKQVVGAGGAAIGGTQGTAEGEVMLHEVIPAESLTSVTARGFEDPDGYAGIWFVRAYALCATPPAGLERVFAQSPTDDFDPGSATATCPVGKNVLGAGAQLIGGAGTVVLDDMRPDALLRSVTATGFAGDQGVVGASGVAAYAICANP